MNLIEKYKKDPNVLNIYQFGSFVYGTNSINSDIDLILIVNEYFDSENIDVHVYTVKEFELSLQLHDIQSIECVSADYNFCYKKSINFEIPKIDLQQLRKSISTICNNSYVKGKKKLIVAGDYDMYIAIKSVFHSLRIYDYGYQIALYGHIYNFGSVNYIWDDLLKLSEKYKRVELWNQIESKYKKTFNEFATKFKKVAPKDLDENDKRKQLENLLINTFGELNDTLKYSILSIFEK
jgi:predicted nucleotidyltransferase